VTAEATISRTGHALKCVPKTPGANVFTQKTVNFTLSPNTVIEAWVYCDGDPATSVTSIGLYFGQTSNMSKFFSFVTLANTLVQGWNHFMLDASQLTAGGGALFDGSPIILLRMAMTYTGSSATPFYWDDLEIGSEYEPHVIIMFDDNDGTIDTNAVPYMAARGIVGTRFINSDLIGGDGATTTANLDTIYALGWDVANHTADHTNLTTLTTAQVVATVEECRDYIIAHGWLGAENFMAYPYNAYDASVISAVTSCGVLAARAGWIGNVLLGGTPNGMSTDMTYHLPTNYSLSNTVPLATVKTAIDNAIKYGQTITIVLHSLGEAAGAGTWTIADWQALMDYIVARKIRCLTVSEWYNGLTNPRYRSLPVGRA